MSENGQSWADSASRGDEIVENHFVGLVLLIVGCSTALVFSSHEDQDYDWPRMQSFVEAPIAFVPVGGGIAIILVIIANTRLRKKEMDAFTFTFVYSFIGALDLLGQKWFFQLGRIYVDCSGLISSESSPIEDSGSCNPPTWVSVVSMGVLGVLHALVLLTENTATTFGDTLANRPLFLSADAVFQVLLCGVFFEEFSTFSAKQYLYFIFGFFVMFCGVVVTIRASPKQSEEEIEAPLRPNFVRAESHQILRLGYRRCPVSTMHNHQVRRSNTTQVG